MVYVDTSVVVALLTFEPSTEAVKAWFADEKQVPVSSDWLLTEFSSAISIKIRAAQLSETHAKAVYREFQLLVASGLRLQHVSRAAFKFAGDMAKAHKYGLRSGDSLHLATAVESGATSIATLDVTMAKNAKRLKMALVKF